MSILPPAVQPTAEGKYPETDDRVVVTQLEICRLDFINRVMVKIHETDDAFMSALLGYYSKLHVLPRLADAKTDRERRRLQDRHAQRIDFLRLIDALRHNHDKRRLLIANNFATILVARRRDNVEKIGRKDNTITQTLTANLLQPEVALLLPQSELPVVRRAGHQASP
jgi:hypothetical protein